MYRSVCFARLHIVLVKACGVIGKAKQSSNPRGRILVAQGHGRAERWHCLNPFQCTSSSVVHPEGV